MVRSYWIGPVLVVLAVTGLAWSQMAPMSTAPAVHDHTLTVQETDKQPLKCKILKMWREPNGYKAYLVQACATDELITIVQMTPAISTTPGTPGQASTKIYHWGDDNKPPVGTPMAPLDATVLGTTAPGSIHRETMMKVADNSVKASPYGQQWPSAYTPDTKDVKPASPVVIEPAPIKSPIQTTQIVGVEVKKDVPYTPSASGMPTQMQGNDYKNPSVAATAPTAPVKPPMVFTGPKPVVTDIVSRPDAQGASTVKSVPSSDGGTANTMVVQTPVKLTVSGFVPDPVVEPTPKPTMPDPVVPTKPSPVVAQSKPTPAVVKNVEPAKPNDWRQSWGKVDSPAPYVPGVDLPHADTSKPDPLQVPDRNPKQPATVAKPTTTPMPPVALLAQPTQADASVKPVSPALPAKPMDTKPAYPLGMGSIYQAKVEQPSATPTAPTKTSPTSQSIYDGGNAFSPPQPIGSNPNQGMQTTAQPQQPFVMIPMDRNVPGGMANAFTSGGSTRPIPSDFGGQAQPGNAFSSPAGTQVAMAMPSNANAAGPNMVAMTDRRPTPMQTMDHGSGQGGNTPQLLAVLRDSLYPSQREWAAESLASLHGCQSQPQVVQGLVTGAKDDPAATVRASCVRAIAQLQINTVPALAVVQALKADPDPRVRREVEQALPVLMGKPMMPVDPAVRPASSH